MRFHSFLVSLVRIVKIDDFDDRVDALVPLLTNLASADLIPFINLSHRDWLGRHLKNQQLSHNHAANITQFDAFPTIAQVYDFVCRASAVEISERLAMLYSLPNRLARFDYDWIYNVIMEDYVISLNTETLLETLVRIVSKKGVQKEDLWHAYAVSRDLGKIAQIVLSKNLTHLRAVLPVCGVPIIREHIPTLSPVAAWEKLGPCILEPKRDGYYCQVHKLDDTVFLYSVKGEDWAIKYFAHFSDLITSIRHHIQLSEIILEAELIALDKNQELLSRKNFWEAANYQLLIYDLLFANGIDWTVKPYYMRKEELIRVVRPTDKRLAIPTEHFVNSFTELDRAFFDQPSSEFEGVIAKLPIFVLRPGQKSTGRIKVKKHENIDVTLVGVVLGNNPDGSEFPNEYLLAIYDSRSDRFPTIGYVSEGLTPEDYEKLKVQIQGLLTEIKPFRVTSLDRMPDRWLEPEIVLEVKFEKIEINSQAQESEVVPRVLGISFAKDCLRTRDKKPEDSSTIEDLKDYATLNQSKA